jgi:hypothetical protein
MAAQGMFGAGSLYIALPHGRRFDAAYNCTPGVMLMNESRALGSGGAPTVVVYTEPEFDPAGVQRAIPLGDDVFYPGTCEADVVCAHAALPKEAEPCAEGYVCDETTTLNASNDFLCRGGYVCDFGTTPDVDLEAPFSQVRTLCPAGFYCPSGTGRGQAVSRPCPAGYFCPTGTAMADLGFVASDALVRNVTVQLADPFYGHVHLTHLGNDDVRVVSEHDQRCFFGIDRDLYFRYRTRWQNARTFSNNPSVAFLNVPRHDNLNGGHPFRPVSTVAADGFARRNVPEAACNASRPYTAAHVLEELGLGLDEVDQAAWERRCLARPSVVQRSVEHDLG